jgi:hypothetical protein
VRSVSLLLPALLVTTTALAGTAPVVGGSSVPTGKWPDAVAVIGTKGTCTGTLIAPTVVLTAGHCSGIDAKQVIANTTDYAGSGGLHANIKSVTAYPNWETSYDVSVILLATPITGIAPRAHLLGLLGDLAGPPGRVRTHDRSRFGRQHAAA